MITKKCVALSENKLFQSNLKVVKLYNHPEFVSTCAEWGLNEWGYLHPGMVLEECKKLYMNFGNKDALPILYILLLNQKIPVGMFLLLPHSPEKKNAELWDVYVDKSYRHRGFANYMITEAKKEAQKLGYQFLFLDTLKPSLNKFYKQFGARLMGEGYLFNAPCDKFIIDLHHKEEELDLTYRERRRSI